MYICVCVCVQLACAQWWANEQSITIVPTDKQMSNKVGVGSHQPVNV